MAKSSSGLVIFPVISYVLVNLILLSNVKKYNKDIIPVASHREFQVKRGSHITIKLDLAPLYRLSLYSNNAYHP